METKTIKISRSTYRRVCEHAGELQKQLGEPVSIDRTLSFLLMRNTLSDLAGSWKMSEKEAEELLRDLRRGWSRWKIPSV